MVFSRWTVGEEGVAWLFVGVGVADSQSVTLELG